MRFVENTADDLGCLNPTATGIVAGHPETANTSLKVDTGRGNTTLEESVPATPHRRRRSIFKEEDCETEQPPSRDRPVNTTDTPH